MNKVVQILMERDGMTRSEAESLVSDCREEILLYPDEAEETIMGMLGLEMDYLFDLI